ncbi:ABC transporter substrate-binding protein [Thiothrix subterranea]|uniref:ABC transporter substrate-binding protein n=1 Tax=Thiothrix subterranea TaxID=2735563 RepID=A0AA51QYX7_9GAMM|nr:ABC transporter substrate-binding protein [Thiothrix subterranea]WML86437.1 ABC transporter substrate-binding protein [Thiothrix subterranea]
MKNNNKSLLTAILLSLSLNIPIVVHAEDGVSATEITIGGVMDLEGRSSGLGLGMKAGIEAALANQTVAGRKVRFIAENDSYTPDKAVAATEKLIAQKVLLFAGNVGTPTAQVVLPLLEQQKIPALGFFTGAGLLRPGQGDIINFRASYVQETKAVIDAALQHGVKPNEVCAYVQNDAYGMAGVAGIRSALQKSSGVDTILTALDKIIAASGAEPERNNQGPVGVYTRNTFIARDGYDSLKAWEQQQGSACKLVVTVGTYEAIARFIAYAHSKNEPWVFSAVSFTGADDFRKTLNKFNITNRVIMTQVVPLPESDLPIVQEARTALGKDYGYVSQEGYIVGKLLLHGLRQLEADEKNITRTHLLATFKGQRFDLGGLAMDFTNDNQGSDLVVMTRHTNDKWLAMQDSTWSDWLDQQQKTPTKD